MKYPIASAVVIAGLAFSPAMAQNQQPQPAPQPEMQQQQQQQDQQPQQGAQQPMQQPETAPAPQAQQPMDQPPAAAEATPTDRVEYVTEQQRSDWLASSLIGRAVYNVEGDRLGSINDVVLDEGGEAVAVVIGVGGFLGIGQKEIGVSYASLEFKPRPQPEPAPGGGGAPTAAVEREDPKHGDMMVVLNATKDELQNAPEYRKLGQRPAEGAPARQ